MSRTPTLPPDDKKMWRWIVARAHPDAGGTHEGFIWTQSVRNHVCQSAKGRPSAAPTSEPRTVYEDGRVPYPAGAIFEELTTTALQRAGAVGEPYERVLLLLEDCHILDHLVHEEQRGASYKRLAYIAHLAGMSRNARIEWYRIAESIPLADRHAGHLIKKLKEQAA